MKFSIIVPLYNKAPYVRHALESVVAQTYKDWELIVVNDGSTDESLQVVEDFFQCKVEGAMCKVISQANAGVAAARNRGVKESKGEYVCFLDADDWWEPNYLEEMDKLIKSYPDAGLYGMNYIYYKPGKTHVAITKAHTGYINYPKAYLENNEMLIFTSSSSSSRKIFDEMGGFPKGIKLGEDFLLWAKISLHYPVVIGEKPLAYYNNDVPATLRATRNLHAPEHSMFFQLDAIEQELNSKSKEQRAEWKALLDWQRTKGLMNYWLNDEYHKAAAEELKKVDWSMQPKSVVRQYKTPIWILRARRRFMRLGSFVKQKFLRIFTA